MPSLSYLDAGMINAEDGIQAAQLRRGGVLYLYVQGYGLRGVGCPVRVSGRAHATVVDHLVGSIDQRSDAFDAEGLLTGLKVVFRGCDQKFRAWRRWQFQYGNAVGHGES